MDILAARKKAAERMQEQKQQAMQRQKQEAEAKVNAEMMKSKRKSLGAAADGKSDAEVNRLYDAKVRKDTDTANKQAAAARSAMSQPQNDAALKSVTGKSMKDLEKMSDAELEALSKDLEKKYGAK